MNADIGRRIVDPGPMGTAKRVVIVGCGFAGVAAAIELRNRHVVTWVDPGEHFEFTPNIHELVSERKTVSALTLSRPKMAGRLGHRFVKDAVTKVDPLAREVHTAGGATLTYDALILAPGGVPRSRAEGVEANACHFATARDAVEIGRRVKVLAGLASPSDVNIVGGGFTGVELLGEILRKYRKRSQLRLRMIESGQRLLGDGPKPMGKRVAKLAKRSGVELCLGARVTSVGSDQLELDSGAVLSSDLTIWTTGKGGPRFLFDSGLTGVAGSWIAAQPSLQTMAWPEIFAAGDAAALARSHDKQARVALAMGRHAAKGVKRLLSGRAPKRFRIDDAPLLLTFGGLSCFVFDDDGVFEGKALAAGRELMFDRTMREIEAGTKKKRAGRSLFDAMAQIDAPLFDLSLRRL